ncbi:transposase and inactivated derivatives [Corynebacterium glutamicum]|nr:transposase and inactivated derivatives [Corynebacterium glutamicum]
MKSEGICPPTVEYRRVKYLNNVFEGGHGWWKRILGPKTFSRTGLRVLDVERDGGGALIVKGAMDNV